MRVLRMIVITVAVHVRRHYRNETASVLFVISLAKFYSSDLRDGIGFIRRFQVSREQTVLFNRLWRKFGINAARPKEQKLFYFILISCMDHVVLDHEIIV